MKEGEEQNSLEAAGNEVSNAHTNEPTHVSAMTALMLVVLRWQCLRIGRLKLLVAQKP